MWRGRGGPRPWRAGWSDRRLGTARLCVVVNAGRKKRHSHEAFGDGGGEHCLGDGLSPPVGAGTREGRGSLERGEVVRMRIQRSDLRRSVRINVARAGASRGPSVGWSDRCLGTAPLRVVSSVQAKRNDILIECLGPAAEGTVSGMGGPCRWAPD